MHCEFGPFFWKSFEQTESSVVIQGNQAYLCSLTEQGVNNFRNRLRDKRPHGNLKPAGSDASLRTLSAEDVAKILTINRILFTRKVTGTGLVNQFIYIGEKRS